MAVRPPPSCSSVTWGTYLVLPCHGYLCDCPDGPPLPGRTRPVTGCVPTDLPSGDGSVARGCFRRITEEHLREGQDTLERPAAEVLHYRNDKGPLHVV